MPIDFGLINGGSGLPDFVGGALKQQQEEEARRQQMAIAMAQINAQAKAAGPNELDYRKDARAAAYDAVKLAREQQAMGLDVNADSRAERGLVSDISLTDSRKNEIGNNIKLNWEKFGVDKDIAYKDFDLRKDMHEFTKENKKTEQAYNIKWGENADQRDERRFQFDINKHQQKLDQEQNFRAQLQSARKQGIEQYRNVLLDQGLVQEASVFEDIQDKLYNRQFKLEGEEEKKKYNEAFPIIAYDIMKNGTLSTANANAVLRLTNTKIPVDNLTEGDRRQLGTTVAISLYGDNLTKVGQNPGKLLASALGKAPIENLSDARYQDREKFLVSKNESAQIDKKIQNNLNMMAEIADLYPFWAGNFHEDVASIPVDFFSTVEQIGSKFGYPGMHLRNADEAYERLSSLRTVTASMIAKSAGASGEDKEGQAKTLKFFAESLNSGGGGIRSYGDSLHLIQNIQNNAMLNAIAEKHPDMSLEKISRNALKMAEVKQSIESQLGRSLSTDEFNEFLSEYGD